MDSKASAEAANDYVKEFDIVSATHPKFAGLTREQQARILGKLQEVRDVSGYKSNLSLGLDIAFDDFAQRTAKAKEKGSGNCHEKALLAVDYIAKNHPETRAEMFSMPEVDHVFCVINRERESDPKNPASWGESAYVCDPWAEEVYPAQELTKPRDYQFSECKIKETSDHQITWLDVKLVDVQFDPNKHSLKLSEYNSDFIGQTYVNENVDAIVDTYRERTTNMVSALNDFSTDLGELQTGLHARKQTEKAEVVGNKIQATRTEINRINQELEEHVPNREDYIELRDDLSTKISNNYKKVK